MRGKKTYNIRNIEAHISGLENAYKQNTPIVSNHMEFNKNMIFQTNALNVIKTSEQQKESEYINAQIGASKYTSNQVSGKMFKNI
jgi:hypothetical protein